MAAWKSISNAIMEKFLPILKARISIPFCQSILHPASLVNVPHCVLSYERCVISVTTTHTTVP